MQCEAKSKSTGERCRRRAVADKKVCTVHGGLTPSGADSPHFKHGRYGQFVSGKIAEKLDAFGDSDALNVLPELQMQRALFAEYLSRFDGIPLPAGDIQNFMSWADQIARTAERAVKMRNETALTAAEVQFLAARVVDVVGKYISDADQQRAFVNELFSGLPALTA